MSVSHGHPAPVGRVEGRSPRGAVRAIPRLAALCLLVASLLLASVGLPDGAVAASVWSAPVRVSADLGGWFADVAADDSGNVSVVWQADVAGASRHDVSALYLARRLGSNWSKPSDIALISPAGHALRSSLVADSTGRLHLVYKGLGTLRSGALGSETLWYTSAGAGDRLSVASWSRTKQITRESQGYFSDIALDSKGVIHVIWTESAKGIWGVYYSNSKDGGATWSVRVPLSGDSPVWWYRAQLVVDSLDRVHVVWETLASSSKVSDPSLGLGLTQATAYALSADGGRSWTTKYLTEDLPPYRRLVDVEHGPQQPAIGVDGSSKILMVYRDPRSNLILSTWSSDGVQWSAPSSLPGVRVGVPRPYDVYDMATDSAGRVHLVVVGYLVGSSEMSLLHLEWSGESWSYPDVVTNAPEYPEYPKLAISGGNQLHVVWFSGDKATIDRSPTGVWYSTATTSAPARQSYAVPPPAPSVSKVGAVVPTPIAPVVRAPAEQARDPAANAAGGVRAPESSLGLADDLLSRPDLPLILALVTTAPLLAYVVGRQVPRGGASGPRGYRFRP